MTLHDPHLDLPLSRNLLWNCAVYLDRIRSIFPALSAPFHTEQSSQVLYIAQLICRNDETPTNEGSRLNGASSFFDPCSCTMFLAVVGTADGLWT